MHYNMLGITRSLPIHSEGKHYTFQREKSSVILANHHFLANKWRIKLPTKPRFPLMLVAKKSAVAEKVSEILRSRRGSFLRSATPLVKVTIGLLSPWHPMTYRQNQLKGPRQGWIPSGKHTKSYRKLSFIDVFPSQRGDFPRLCEIPEGTWKNTRSNICIDLD